LTNGTVTRGFERRRLYNLTAVPPNLTNAIVIRRKRCTHWHCGRTERNGVGYNNSGETSVPAGLSNVVAISAGYQFSLAVIITRRQRGGWGNNTFGQCNVLRLKQRGGCGGCTITVLPVE